MDRVAPEKCLSHLPRKLLLRDFIYGEINMLKYKPLKTGEGFGKLTVVSLDNTRKGPYYICKCKCGKEKSIYKYDLIYGKSKSCGCVTRAKASERCKQRNYKHGLGRTRLCHIWADMKRRCYDIKSKDYKDYGNRGIIICEEWLKDFVSFYNWAMANGYNDNLTIDRIDVDGNYEPANCRWVTITEQARNRRNNYFITYKGETKCLSEWSRGFGIGCGTLKYRLTRGWSVDKVFTTAVR